MRIPRNRMPMLLLVPAAVAALVSGSGCLPDPYSVGEPDSLFSEYALIWDLMDQRYGGFCGRASVDWDLVRAEFSEAAISAGDWDELHGVVVDMLGEMDDSQLYLQDPEGEPLESHDPGFVNWDEVVWADYVTDWGVPNILGMPFGFTPLPDFQDTVGYGFVYDLGDEYSMEQFYSSTVEIRYCSKLIIDLRMCSGGLEVNAQTASGRFWSATELAYWRSFRDGEGRLDMTEPQAVNTHRNGAWQFDGPTYVLTGRGTDGAGELLALLLSSQEQVVLVGDTTAGSPAPGTLYNLVLDWKVSIPGSAIYFPDGNPMLGIGLAPDILVECTEEDLEEGIDPVLEYVLGAVE